MVAAVRTGPLVGLIAQIVLLVILAGSVDLGAVGWVAGAAYGVGLYALLVRGLPAAGLGPADRVTLGRATLVGGVTALAADAYGRTDVPVAVLVGLTIAALVGDWIDGQVSRRTQTASAFGARFDMEVDSFLLLVLSLYAARSAGLWVLAIGGMRYAFVAAGWVLPWMRATLPPRYWRKVVAATQGIVLVVATAGVLPAPVMLAGLALSLVLLVESFGRDVRWLWRNGRRPAEAPGEAPVAVPVVRQLRDTVTFPPVRRRGLPAAVVPAGDHAVGDRPPSR
jgi:phosphatidylglycerophosphate synthase